jgi:molecular chaperone DnaK (HSP70)
MMRTKIDYGIDLGTCYSSIAVFHGYEADVLRQKTGEITGLYVRIMEISREVRESHSASLT